VQEIQIVWFKRDLRTNDHQPIYEASTSGLKTLFIYILEPAIIQNKHYSKRHFRFIFQSLSELQNQLCESTLQLNCFEAAAVEVFDWLTNVFVVKQVLSYQETGMDFTYARDKQLKSFFRKKGIMWKEFPSNGIVRGSFNRAAWHQHWENVMSLPMYTVDLKKMEAAFLDKGSIPFKLLDVESISQNSNVQVGGEQKALLVLNDFLNTRCKQFGYLISKPDYSTNACSRLSPYIAWGNLSLRNVVQATKQSLANSTNKNALQRFQRRLQWNAHFIQKFEVDVGIQKYNVNPVFDTIRTQVDENKLRAWKTGQTGYPIVDACMRSLILTGWLNFRMRAMLVSFLTHHLWQPWQEGAAYLASLFLDFEPGIHFPQFQMQAGTTALHILRIYDPIKQGIENDPDGVFIRKWVPELAHLPTPFVHRPWDLTPMEHAFYGFSPGKDYPIRIVDTSKTGKQAAEILWERIKSPKAVAHSNQWLAKQVISPERQVNPPNWLASPTKG